MLNVKKHYALPVYEPKKYIILNLKKKHFQNGKCSVCYAAP